MDWKRFFDRLGLDGSRWQWRMMRWERNIKSFLRGDAGAEGLSVTNILIAINVGLFAVMVLWASWYGQGMSALLRPDTRLLQIFGAQYWPYVIYADQWWRCITYAYTHGGLIHLGFNMMVLYQVGPMIEREIGPARFFTLYTLTALTATVAGLLWHPGVSVVGASGSLFGLIGFAIVYCHRLGEPGRFMRDFMLKWAIFAFLFGLMIGADNAGHLGGALGGALVGALLPIGVRRRRATRGLTDALTIASVAVTVAGLGGLVLSWISIFSGGGGHG